MKAWSAWLTLCLMCWLAQTQANEPVRWNRNEVTLEVVTDEGRTLPLYHHAAREAVYKAYLEAQPEARYRLRVRNNTRGRVGLVIAVDGRNIISGERSQLRHTERMYLLDPGETQDYEGWRTGKDKVNRFYFTDAGDSYAESFGDTSALGVIAVAVYQEKAPPPQALSRDEAAPASRARAKAGAPSAAAEPATGFGETVHSPSVRVEFDPESRPTERYFLRYHWRETLCTRGIAEHGCPRREPPASQRNDYRPVVRWTEPVSVEVTTDGGRALPLYAHSGSNQVYKAYLEALKGKQYGVRVRNNTRGRVGLVIAVDGRNIVSGDQSELAPDERMYVLEPGETQTYEGWRTGKNKVNRFYFTDPGRSYSVEAFGDASALGVIAVAVYAEQPQVVSAPAAREEGRAETGRADAAAPATQAPASTPFGGLLNSKPSTRAKAAPAEEATETAATGFGRTEHSPSVTVTFRPQERPLARYYAKYEWRDTLCEQGIIECRREQRRPPRNRMWEEDEDAGYAPPPRR